MDDLERRLQRAKFHFEDLDVQFQKWRGFKSYPTEPSRKRKDGGFVLNVAQPQPLEPVFGLIAADFVHNLRSLLDNLIWAIAPASLKGHKRLGFPICTNRKTFREFSKTVFQRSMPRGFVAALELHQPYKRQPNEVSLDRLLILHKMWTADKHHAPMGVMGWAVAVTGSVHYTDGVPQPVFGLNLGPLGKNYEVGWITGEGAEQHAYPRVVLDIGFKTRRPTLLVPRHAFNRMFEIVAKEVLPDLRPFIK